MGSEEGLEDTKQVSPIEGHDIADHTPSDAARCISVIPFFEPTHLDFSNFFSQLY